MIQAMLLRNVFPTFGALFVWLMMLNALLVSILIILQRFFHVISAPSSNSHFSEAFPSHELNVLAVEGQSQMSAFMATG